MPRRTYICLLSLLCFFCTVNVYGQCKPPALVQVKESTVTSVVLSWLYFDEADGWELELVPYGATPQLEPTTDLITEKQYTFTDLEPASTYTVFIRTVCGTVRSDWNPVAIRTKIPQPSPCLFTLPIKNNSCRQGLEPFEIAVAEVEGRLGQEVFLASVDLIIEHTWPADLDIRLESPSGKEVALSKNNGTVTDDYGNIKDTLCREVTRFADLACSAIQDARPPFIGDYIPEVSIYTLSDSTSPNGTWKLMMCDRSNQDLGYLKYVKLNFEPLLCDIPKDIIVKSINATKVEVVWTPYDGCRLTEVELSLRGEPSGSLRTTSIPCEQGSITIDNLTPDTEYDIYVLSNCLSDQKSPLSCAYTFKTACTEVTEVESFDFQSTCTPSCALECAIDGTWTNDTTDDQDWIVWDAETDTDGTGPRKAVFDGGSYIYMEASPDICKPNATAVLSSSCIRLSSNEQACDMSFWYHMYGSEIGTLSLLIQVNESEKWDTIFHISGDQGNQWHNQILSLKQYNDDVARFQFVGRTATGTKGDIALDQIDFRGSIFVPEGIAYYQDKDADGFGTNDSIVRICSAIVPDGFALQNGDCDDTNAEINPSAQEIPCNGIDENCNGNADDSPPASQLTYTTSVTKDACAEPNTGAISITIDKGNAPYRYNWSNGKTTKDIARLSTGYYIVTITDNEGCTLASDSIFVDRVGKLAVEVAGANPSNCQNGSDGSIEVTARSGTAPYTYSWSDGGNGNIRSDIPAGTYKVVASDQNGCQSDTLVYSLKADKTISGDVSFRLDVSCYGGDNGILRVDALTGIAPFHYIWNTGDETQQITGQKAGDYICTITDAQGCQGVVHATLDAPIPLAVDVVNLENVNCYGEATGSIKMNARGGTPPYTFAWDSGQKTDDIFDLRAGTYRLKVTDANACTALSEQIKISEPPQFLATVDSAVYAKCLLSKDGYLRVKAEGGTPGYNYFWAANMTDTSVLEQVDPGVYSITITDENNCKTTVSNYELKSLSQPIDIELITVGENVCYDDSIVSIIATLDNATAPIDYNWNVGENRVKQTTIDTLRKAGAGQYVVTATDKNGCLGISDTLWVTSADPIEFELLTLEPNICYDATQGALEVVALGGVAPYTYRWSNGDTTSAISNLANGKYNVTITDANTCELVSQNISITSPPSFLIDVKTTPETSATKNGSIQLTITGGTPTYSIQWQEDIVKEDETTATGLTKGDYTIMITDRQGCDTTIVVTVDFSSRVSDVLEDILQVYPNPFEEYLTIETTKTIQNVRLLDVNGRRENILIQKKAQNEYRIETNQLASGLYFLEMVCDEKRIVRKVVKL